MLGSIEDLEKEIEQFQNNVAASMELQVLLKQMVDELRKQTNTFDLEAKSLLTKIEVVPGNIDNSAHARNEQLKQHIEEYIHNMHDLEKKYEESTNIAVMDLKKMPEVIGNNLEESNKKLVDDIKVILDIETEKIEASYKLHESSLLQTQAEIKKCQEQLENKYRDFIDILEKTNIANIYNQNTELKKALDTKSLVLTVITGVSLIIGIVGLFI